MHCKLDRNIFLLESLNWYQMLIKCDAIWIQVLCQWCNLNFTLKLLTLGALIVLLLSPIPFLLADHIAVYFPEYLCTLFMLAMLFHICRQWAMSCKMDICLFWKCHPGSGHPYWLVSVCKPEHTLISLLCWLWALNLCFIRGSKVPNGPKFLQG